ncbi:DNA translocase FtsK [Yoonia vestfoldensis]|uniref:DNA translocase FtsK n=2 Tax=Yoonia vestfoldensis TaxID=245188 RepID=A0A1Y0EHU1_9RHOB|nr:DNA translocase FtsK [Yoonia vestfoldensis]
MISTECDAPPVAYSNEEFSKAVQIVTQNQKCSTSYIQRQMGIGYNRAARIVEQLQADGYVSAADHVGRREILTTSGPTSNAPDTSSESTQMTIQDWLESGDTGASVRAIVAHLTGIGESTGIYPSDAADFGRCERMLATVPGLRPELHRMTEINDYWAALVPQWDAIRGSSDQTAMIKTIVQPIEERDPGHIPLGEDAHMRTGSKITFKASGVKAKRNHMKPDPEFDAARDKVNSVAAEELRQFIERFERLEAEKKDITDGQKEVMAEAKGRGYDTKVLRKIMPIRKRDANDLAEEQAVMDLYMSALGMV